MTKAERKELTALRLYRKQTEKVLHILYDELYFAPDHKVYDPDKSWESAGEFQDLVAGYLQWLMGKPKKGSKNWPKIACLSSLDKP